MRPWLTRIGAVVLLGLVADATSAAAAEPLPPLAELLLHTRPGAHVVVHEVRFAGNTVFSAQQLGEVAAPYLDRPLVAEDLLELRDAITALYLQRGYASSGAVIEAQDARSGVLGIRIVEGYLSTVEVRGNRGFASSYLAKRFAHGARGALRVGDLERELRVLQADPRVRAIRAELVPGGSLGESRLLLDMEEAAPLSLALSTGNGWSPAVGENGAELFAALANPLGRGDELRAVFSRTEGLQSSEAHYLIPLGTAQTLLELSGQWSRADVVEDQLEELDIASQASTYRAGLRQALYRSEGSELWLGLHAEHARSRTRLLGERFAFSPGTDDAEIRTTLIALSQDWIARSRARVLALSSSFRFGLDALGATDIGGGDDIPDASFAYWLGQAQWVERLPRGWLASQLVARLDVQLSANPLFPSEQLALGGARTVRGYRRNRLVRDNGLVASVEARIPVLRSPLGHERVQLAPFVDLGHAWNHRDTFGPRTLPSAGLGLYLRPAPNLLLSLQYARPLRNLDRPGDDLQDYGIHFEATWLSQ